MHGDPVPLGLPPAYPETRPPETERQIMQLQAQVDVLTETVAQLQAQVGSLTRLVHSRTRSRRGGQGKDDVARASGAVDAGFRRVADGAG